MIEAGTFSTLYTVTHIYIHIDLHRVREGRKYLTSVTGNKQH